MILHPVQSVPSSIEELTQRANALAGLTLGELANNLAVTLPVSTTKGKGWPGQLIEKALGASSFNLDQPDFPNLGVELKTLPIKQGKVVETTFICVITIPHREVDFFQSRLWRKMAQILWVPLDKDHALISEFTIGTPLLWRPSTAEQKILQADWEELTELLTLGHFDKINAHKGVYLQIRPKAANAKTVVRVIDSEGLATFTGPKGFYIRTQFTQQILNENYI